MKHIVSIIAILTITGCVPQQQVDHAAGYANDRAHWACGANLKLKAGTQKYRECYQREFNIAYAQSPQPVYQMPPQMQPNPAMLLMQQQSQRQKSTHCTTRESFGTLYTDCY